MSFVLGGRWDRLGGEWTMSGARREGCTEESERAGSGICAKDVVWKVDKLVILISLANRKGQ